LKHKKTAMDGNLFPPFKNAALRRPRRSFAKDIYAPGKFSIINRNRLFCFYRSSLPPFSPRYNHVCLYLPGISADKIVPALVSRSPFASAPSLRGTTRSTAATLCERHSLAQRPSRSFWRTPLVFSGPLP